MNITPSRPSGTGRLFNWLIMTAVIALLILVFARKITQLSLPGLGVAAKTAVVDPKCPTPQQKEVIERNLKLYGAGFSQNYPNQIYGSNLLAMAKTLGYPDPDMRQINAVIRFLRQAVKMPCGGK